MQKIQKKREGKKLKFKDKKKNFAAEDKEEKEETVESAKEVEESDQNEEKDILL